MKPKDVALQCQQGQAIRRDTGSLVFRCTAPRVIREGREGILPGELELQTDRLRLRPYRLSDFEAMHGLMSRRETHRFPRREPFSEEESWTRLLRHIGHWSEFGYGFMAVEERAGGRFVGEAGLGLFQRGLGPDYAGYPEATWTVASDCQGRGYATEAAAAVLDWADRNGLARTRCMIHCENAPSLAVAAKLGYVEIGRALYLGQPVIFFERPQPLSGD